MELAIGKEYIMTNYDGGVMAVVVEGFERDGAVALLRPTDPAMAAWYVKGYDLGRSHWEHMLKPVTGEPSTDELSALIDGDPWKGKQSGS